MTQNGPWSGRASSDEPYTEPADPWGDHPTSDAGQSGWGGHPTSIPPAQRAYPMSPPLAIVCLRTQINAHEDVTSVT